MDRPVELTKWGSAERPTFTVRRDGRALGIICYQPPRHYWRIVAHEPGKPLMMIRTWTVRGSASDADRDAARDSLVRFFEGREQLEEIRRRWQPAS